MASPGHERRNISDSQFGDNTNIYQGNVHLYLPHRPARAEVKAVCAIPYPRNEDLVSRPDLINRLDELLPQTPGFYSAALWGLGGSGKTQLALNYAYQRCNDGKCCVFWVHADSEATFTTDYKMIGSKLGVNETLDGSDLLDAVRSSIEALSQWVVVFDNADDLKLFGVGCTEGANESLFKYIPRGSQGTILWTSRDAHIRSTLVGPSRDIMVPPMTRDEATNLLAAASGDKSAVEDAEMNRLLEELQRLPLAVSQAGAYIRRTSMTIKEYLELLTQGSSRWDLLNMNDFDRHRRPEVSNSVLETWRISTRRIREESELSYRILHVVAYLDSQDIPYELIMAAGQHDDGGKGKSRRVSETEVQQAVTRLMEFSFLDMRRGEGGSRSYEMHKLVQEAVRYGLWVQGRMKMDPGNTTTTTAGQNGAENGEAYYSSMALQMVDAMFPAPEQKSWPKCNKYMAHAIRVGEWAEVSGEKIETAALLNKVSQFLSDRGRWSEKEPVDLRALNLRREVLGETHPDTINCMVHLAKTYHERGRYHEAERICTKALSLQQKVRGKKHQETSQAMLLLGTVYKEQGRYAEAGEIYEQAFNVLYELFGERHPETVEAMSCLGYMYNVQGQHEKAEEIFKQAIHFRQEHFGEKHPYTCESMANLAATYYSQGRDDKAEELQTRVVKLRQEEFGEKSTLTLMEMGHLAIIYTANCRYTEAQRILSQVLELFRETFGEKHSSTMRAMADLAIAIGAQGQSDKAEEMQRQVLGRQREILGEEHPSVLQTMVHLAISLAYQGQFDKAEEMQRQALGGQRKILGEEHPNTITSIRSLEGIIKDQDRQNKQKLRRRTLRDVLHTKFRRFKESE
ncbi:hypothetical protein ACQKWADRAFT_3642 [Trichoderma austrokoningii]